MRSDDPDPTRVPDQAALQSSRRGLWLVSAGVLTGVTVVVFAMTAVLDPALSTIGIALVVGLYGAMIVVAVSIRADRRRNLAFAVLMLSIVIVGVGLLLGHVLQQSAGG